MGEQYTECVSVGPVESRVRRASIELREGQRPEQQVAEVRVVPLEVFDPQRGVVGPEGLFEKEDGPEGALSPDHHARRFDTGFVVVRADARRRDDRHSPGSLLALGDVEPALKR